MMKNILGLSFFDYGDWLEPRGYNPRPSKRSGRYIPAGKRKNTNHTKVAQNPRHINEMAMKCRCFKQQ